MLKTKIKNIFPFLIRAFPQLQNSAIQFDYSNKITDKKYELIYDKRDCQNRDKDNTL